ncbi:hypothetical protein [Fretibacter rubidus]|uniref:hypothetical protein n=1 Tax=Fretibacter rubidus TaxID=570162 RepID=UPI00352BA6E6
MEKHDPKIALRNTFIRLGRMKRHWEKAAAAYFDPDDFIAEMQASITTARTVTFVLQSNKKHLPDFENWYGSFQEKWKTDPIMKWAVNARNSIVKRGDLETESEARVLIIASYLGAAESKWSANITLLSLSDIVRNIPKKLLIPQVINHGTLVLERRWIDQELPEIEVLEALTHVYSQFLDLLKSLFKHYDIETDEKFDFNLPEYMSPLVQDRAVYFSIKDGRRTGYRTNVTKMDPLLNSKIKRKYRSTSGAWRLFNRATNFEEACAAMFKVARAVMKKDGYHLPITLFLSGNDIVQIASPEIPDRASKYLIQREMAKLAYLLKSDGVIMIGEVWRASFEDTPASGYAAEAENRSEGITLNGANSSGECHMFEAKIERGLVNKRKVRHIGETNSMSNNFQFIMAPYQEIWGCLPNNLEDIIADFEKQTGVTL